ncbi:hypothetical protein ALC56_08234, partial [Trachymyrmex septentrionalis]
HYFSRVFQKPPRLDVIDVDHSTRRYTAFKRGIDLSPDERSFVATRVPLPTCTKRRSNCVFLGTTKLFEPLDALVASLQPRETFRQSSDLTALLQQFAFHSLVIFHVFFFRSHSSTEHLHVTRSHTLQRHDISRKS